MSVTLKEIARHTGLSVPTVGNVLGRASSRYSATTRQKVLQAVEELGYRPNSSARAMRQGRIGCAALVLSRGKQAVVSHVPVGLLDGLDDELAAHDMHLTVSRLTDEQLSRDDFVPKVLREYMADGMIMNYTHGAPPRVQSLIQAHHTPAVWLNVKLAADCVHPDDRGAAVAITQRLITAGHRRIAFVHLAAPEVFPGLTYPEARERFHYSVADRTSGYVDTMLNVGLTPRIAFDDRYVSDDASVPACRALLSGPDRPTAVILYSEVEAPAMLLAARSLAMEIPRDLTVAEFYPAARRIADIRLAVVPIPTGEMGRSAVRMLLEKIKSPGESCPPIAVPYRNLPDDAIAPPALITR